MRKLFKYERNFDITISLNPFSWFNKPRYYRFDWKKANSSSREGQFDFGPFSFFWYREAK